MKIKCIENNTCLDLTIGKTYDVISISDLGKYYLIIDDENDESWYIKEYFKPLSEIRNETIDKLLE